MFLRFFSCYVLVFVTSSSATNGVLFKDTPKNKPENYPKNTEDGDLRVDLDIADDDYNWVEYDLLNKQLTEPFKEIDKITKEIVCKGKGEHVNDKRPEAIISNIETDNSDTTGTKLSSFHSIERREVPIETEAAHTNGKHFEETKENSEVKAANSNCTTGDAYDVGIRGIKCLFLDCKEHKQPFHVLAARISHVALIWLSVYGALAIPFWCIKGWCCCCLCCKFFKPRETIQEAKDYLILNPPGVLVTKKGAIIHYEPTEREKDCYEEFGHFMRTL